MISFAFHKNSKSLVICSTDEEDVSQRAWIKWPKGPTLACQYLVQLGMSLVVFTDHSCVSFYIFPGNSPL